METFSINKAGILSNIPEDLRDRVHFVSDLQGFVYNGSVYYQYDLRGYEKTCSDTSSVGTYIIPALNEGISVIYKEGRCNRYGNNIVIMRSIKCNWVSRPAILPTSKILNDSSEEYKIDMSMINSNYIPLSTEY